MISIINTVLNDGHTIVSVIVTLFMSNHVQITYLLHYKPNVCHVKSRKHLRCVKTTYDYTIYFLHRWLVI